VGFGTYYTPAPNIFFCVFKKLNNLECVVFPLSRCLVPLIGNRARHAVRRGHHVVH
jgi:hypothetical protein